MSKSNQKNNSLNPDAKIEVIIGWNVAGVPLEPVARLHAGALTCAPPEGSFQVDEEGLDAVISINLAKIKGESVEIEVVPDPAVWSDPQVFVTVETLTGSAIKWTQKYPLNTYTSIHALSLIRTADGWLIRPVVPKRTPLQRILARLGF